LADYTLRAARQADQSSIRRLIHLGGINPTGLDWKRFVVAVSSDGEVIGCGQLKPHGKDVLELASIAVHPERRRAGIASAIISHLLGDVPRPLYLMCRSPLGPMYEKYGFRVLEPAEMPTYFRRISSLVGMVEALRREGETLLIMKLQ
jgi:N-acetylglutamate synthase-like GNAT family acetyltransferase